MKQWIGSASSMEEAVAIGLKALGLGRDQVHVEVIEERGSGLFSMMGTRWIRIKLTERVPGVPPPENEYKGEPRGGRGHERRGRGGRDHDRGGRDNDRGGRDNDRGGRDNDRGGRDNDRGGRDNDRGGDRQGGRGRDHDRGGHRRDDGFRYSGAAGYERETDIARDDDRGAQDRPDQAQNQDPGRDRGGDRQGGRGGDRNRGGGDRGRGGDRNRGGGDRQGGRGGDRNRGDRDRNRPQNQGGGRRDDRRRDDRRQPAEAQAGAEGAAPQPPREIRPEDYAPSPGAITGPAPALPVKPEELLTQWKAWMDLDDLEWTMHPVDGNHLPISVKTSRADRLGRAMESFEHLFNIVMNRTSKEGPRIRFEMEGYVDPRRQKAADLALAAAEEVKATGQVFRMEPMGSADRRVVHQTLANHPDVETTSEGEGPYRKVVVRPKQRG